MKIPKEVIKETPYNRIRHYPEFCVNSKTVI